MLRPIPHPVPLAFPAVSRRRPARELANALAEGELELHYQPKVRIDTDVTTGVEALVRWRHPERGLLFPGSFLPALEHESVLEDLEAHVLEAALAQAAAWRRDGIALSMAVNLSPAGVLDPELPDRVTDALKRWGLPAEALVLEITETAVLRDLERSAAILACLAGDGVRISLDDFGTGHSSLSRLVQLPIDEVKVDRCFVSGMVRDSAGGAVVGAIVSLAQDLGHRVVAEGVEDAVTLDYLAELGCDEAQGFYVCRPRPANELPGWALRATAGMRAEGVEPPRALRPTGS